MGFQPNPFDPSVVNKEIDGPQMTITWNIYDLKAFSQETKKNR